MIVFFGILFGVLVTVAEPALEVLARQTALILPEINERLFVWISSLGIGLAVGFALFRIMKDWSLKVSFTLLYGTLFLLLLVVPADFIGLAFDASGATSGDVSVPFILAMGIGISSIVRYRNPDESVFGIIGLASIGPIVTVLLYGLVLNYHPAITLSDAQFYDPGLSHTYFEILVADSSEVALALFPIIIVFIPFQFRAEFSKEQLLRILSGIIPVYFGLLIFLTGIDYGFAFAGKYIGEYFYEANQIGWLLIVSFGLGISISLSEPAVSVLESQLEELTGGHIKKQTIRFTMAIGIGFASFLSVLKIITGIHILWFLGPLYLIAVLLMKFNSNLFVGLAFDSGGVAGGALTSAFLTPLTLGVAQAVANQASHPQSILANGFGVIAFISVTPLIAVQVLGIIYDRKKHD